MNVLKSLVCLAFVFTAFQLCAVETPKPTQPTNQDPFLYAATHALTNYAYNISTLLLREKLFQSILIASYQNFGGPARIKDASLYTLRYALWLVTLYGRYKLPEWIDSLLGKQEKKRSNIYKLLSLGNRTYYGATGAFVESFLESETENLKKQIPHQPLGNRETI
jgi:hypothetical protein